MLAPAAAAAVPFNICRRLYPSIYFPKSHRAGTPLRKEQSNFLFLGRQIFAGMRRGARKLHIKLVLSWAPRRFYTLPLV
jgi:hypothetical protein